jgi:hypothetical protein
MDANGALPILTVLSLVLTVAFFVLVRRRRARENEDDTPDHKSK